MIIVTLPQCFNTRYNKVVCIIDCSEIFIQRPTALTARAQTYSNYKSYNTVKILVALPKKLPLCPSALVDVSQTNI